MGDTSIQWTEKTWNPIRGCSVISPGCNNCYAMRQAHRFSGEGKPYEGLTKQTKAGPQWTSKVVLVEDHLTDPLKWRKPSRVFVNSMADLFHESVPFEWIDRIFAAMALAPQHTFQILTKRADRMQEYMAGLTAERLFRVGNGLFDPKKPHSLSERLVPMFHGRTWDWWRVFRLQELFRVGLPLPNVWLGVSVENQKYADERIPLLLGTPAAVRFISAEPLLGPVDLAAHLPAAFRRRDTLDWVIVGGESGPRSRPCHTDWIADLVRQCAAASVPCFVKQLGANGYQLPGGYPLRDRKGGDMDEWPADLRVRQFPEVRA